MKKYLFLCCCLASTAYASELEQYCKEIPAVNKKAQQLYSQHQYAKARTQYETAVSYLESCKANFDNVPQKNIDIAYNNVALTYIKQKDYRKALAWLSIAPNAPQTKTNRALIPKLAPITQPQGEYWRYAGQAMWNTYTVKANKKQYKIDFEGLRVGINSLMSGPNMGEYSYTTTIKNQKTTWTNPDDKSCKIQLKFTPDTLHAITQANEEADCGFGYGVTADGTYQRVL